MCGIRRLKPGLRAAKPSLSPYVQNIYRIEVKFIILGKFTEGYLENVFQIFRFFAVAWPG